MIDLPWRRRFPASLVIALALYFFLAATTVREVGLVGEVAIGWALGRPPAVLVQTDPPTWADGLASPTAGNAWGPLVASQVRPVERLHLGSIDLPLAINLYTGGAADWPSRLVWALCGCVAAVVGFHVLLGALLIVLVHRFLRFHGTDVAAGVAALVLATAWSFLFYRKVLGGTEVLLEAAELLCLWSLWSRRWAGGRHGLTGFGLGVGFGFLAKVTFGLSLLALCLTALLTRRDKPPIRPPLPARLWLSAVAALVLWLPLVTAWVHHALAVPASPHVLSHDFPNVQFRRVLGALTTAPSPPRESLGNLLLWLGRPLDFFHAAYGARTSSVSPWRVVGWLIVLGGAALAWRDRHPTPHEALLRFTSLYLVLQVGLLAAVARDLHHLAQAVPTVAIVAGLALDRLAASVTPPRSFARARLTGLLALPWLVSGITALEQTDAIVSSIQVPTFTERGQKALISLLRAHHVRRLVAADYELYGVLDVRAPDIRLVDGWGAVSWKHGAALPDLLRIAAAPDTGYFLVVRASAPMIYNLAPNRPTMLKAAAQAGVTVREVGRLPGGTAVLWKVQPREDER